MTRTTALLGAALVMPFCVQAATVDQALAKLAPEERSREACAIRAMSDLRKNPMLRKVDHIVASTGRQAVLNGTTLTAVEAAARSGGRWYALSFTCQLTTDYMKAVSFTYKLGREIPKAEWERLNLWG
jgi:hypothetical protein